MSEIKEDGLEEAAKAFIRQRNLKRYGVESEHAHWTIAEVAEYTRQQREKAVDDFIKRIAFRVVSHGLEEAIRITKKEMFDGK